MWLGHIYFALGMADEEQLVEITVLAVDPGAERELVVLLVSEGFHVTQHPSPAERNAWKVKVGGGWSGPDLHTLSILLIAAWTPKLIHILLTWMRKNAMRELEVTIGDSSIKLSNASEEDQGKLIEEWVEVMQKKTMKF